MLAFGIIILLLIFQNYVYCWGIKAVWVVDTVQDLARPAATTIRPFDSISTNENRLKLFFESTKHKKDIIIDLEMNEHLIHPSFEVINPSSSNVRVNNCYYHGSVAGNPDSFVHMSLCDRTIDGYISMDGETWVIKRNINGGYFMDKIRRTEYTCTLKHEHDGINDIAKALPHQLIKRSLSQSKIFVEMIIVNDLSRVMSIGNNLESNTFQLMNHVSAVYKRDMNIIVVLKGIINLSYTVYKSPDVNTILAEFGRAKEQLRVPQNDHMQLLVAKDLSDNGHAGNSGLSKVGTICTADSISVVEALPDRSIEGIGNIMAHELGHSLSIPHDGQGAAASCKGGIMESVTCSTCKESASKRFSKCSVNIGVNFAAQQQCLRNRPTSTLKCGNGIVDLNEGEECDEDTPCCDRATCLFKESTCSHESGITGVCSKGKCITTCGNGNLEPHEDCDTNLLKNGCCDPVTCKFRNPKSSCSSGVCNGGDKCVSSSVTETVPEVVLSVKRDGEKYSIALHSAVENSQIYYSLDGTTPVANSSGSHLYRNEISINQQDIESEYEKTKHKYNGTVFKSPFAPDESGVYRLRFQAKAYHSKRLASPTASAILEFGDAVRMDISSIIGIVVAFVFVVILVICILVYRKDIASSVSRFFHRIRRAKELQSTGTNTRPHLQLKRKTSNEQFVTINSTSCLPEPRSNLIMGKDDIISCKDLPELPNATTAPIRRRNSVLSSDL